MTYIALNSASAVKGSSKPRYMYITVIVQHEYELLFIYSRARDNKSDEYEAIGKILHNLVYQTSLQIRSLTTRTNYHPYDIINMFSEMVTSITIL